MIIPCDSRTLIITMMSLTLRFAFSHFTECLNRYFRVRVRDLTINALVTVWWAQALRK